MRSVILLMLMASTASACNIPVFRYALERWKPDQAEILIFHSGSLSEDETQFVTKLRSGAGNVDVNLHNVTESTSEDATAVRDKVSQSAELPFLVVRCSVGRGQIVNAWSGPLSDAMSASIVTSPARTEVGRRLCSGHSVVWLVMKSSDQAKNDAVLKLLNAELKKLAQEIPLPEGIGLPGSELHSDVPLLMKFSVLEVEEGDRNEEFLRSFFRGLDPESAKTDEPLVIPVFGRGRALEVIPAPTVTAELLEDLTVFLSGACSCRVKERNPGFDLLLATDWEKSLFGEDGADIAKPIADSPEPKRPVLLTIPQGSKNRRASDR